MVKCSGKCVPYCGFCIHCKRDEDGDPIGCNLHIDREHQILAFDSKNCRDSYYCRSFHCFRAKNIKDEE